MKVFILLLVALLCGSCSREYNELERLRVCLEDLRLIGDSYASTVSNVLRTADLPELAHFHAVERVDSSADLFLLKRGGMSYLMAIESQPPANSIIACTAEPIEYGGELIWVVQTGIGGYTWFESRIPPVPGCYISPISEHLVYPQDAMARFKLLHTDMAPELDALDGKVSISKGWSITGAGEHSEENRHGR